MVAIMLAFAPSVLNTAISRLLLLTINTRQAMMLNPAIAIITDNIRATIRFSIFIALNRLVISEAHVFILNDGSILDLIYGTRLSTPSGSFTFNLTPLTLLPSWNSFWASS